MSQNLRLFHVSNLPALKFRPSGSYKRARGGRITLARRAATAQATAVFAAAAAADA